MPIQVNLDELMIKRGITETLLARETGLTKANLSKIKNDRSKLLRFSTLDALCKVLDCQPKDIMKYTKRPTEAYDYNAEI